MSVSSNRPLQVESLLFPFKPVNTAPTKDTPKKTQPKAGAFGGGSDRSQLAREHPPDGALVWASAPALRFRLTPELLWMGEILHQEMLE